MLSEADNKFESKFNVLIEEERDEYVAQKHFWVPNKVNSLPELNEKLLDLFYPLGDLTLLLRRLTQEERRWLIACRRYYD